MESRFASAEWGRARRITRGGVGVPRQVGAGPRGIDTVTRVPASGAERTHMRPPKIRVTA